MTNVIGSTPKSSSYVPTKSLSQFLLIGDGRVARHMAHYLELEGRSFLTWSRRDSVTSLNEKIAAATHVFILISDPAIPEFYRAHEALREKTCIHFSGALTLPDLPSAHPLMTFSERLYTLSEYRRIPFIIEKGRLSASELLPGFANPIYEIESSQKTLYHSLCVLSGNFSTILWEKAFASFSSDLHLHKQALLPYLEQITRNLIESQVDQSVLSGPLVRKDSATIDKHLAVLKNDPFRNVYQAFVDAYGEAHNRRNSS